MLKLSTIIIATALFSSCNKNETTVGEVHTDTIPIEKTSQPAKTILIDVRAPEEFKGGYLNNATNIPHGEIAEKITVLTTDKDSKIILYCRSGSRAGMAKKALNEAGYTDVTNAGGYEELKAKEIPSE